MTNPTASININENRIKKFRIFVFANLKTSQINYKIIPLSKSLMVEQVVILRKTPLDLDSTKIICIGLPTILRVRPLYWLFSFIYGIYQINKYKTTLILSYNIFPHGLNAFLSSLFLKQKTIFSEINEDTKKYYKNVFSKSIIRIILNNASIICTPGENTSKFWNNAGYHNTFQLHSTIDIDKFKPDNSVEKKYDFIYIGTLDKNKRPDVTIKAFAKIVKLNKDLQLCMIGFGPLEVLIKQMIVQLNIDTNVDVISSNTVLNHIQESKIFVMSSLSEGLPCAMMEAMACELIPIVPPVGDISNIIIHGENGYLHNNTVEEMAYYMYNTIENYDSFNQMKKNARLTIQNDHSFSIATKKWNSILPLLAENQ